MAKGKDQAKEKKVAVDKVSFTTAYKHCNGTSMTQNGANAAFRRLA